MTQIQDDPTPGGNVHFCAQPQSLERHPGLKKTVTVQKCLHQRKIKIQIDENHHPSPADIIHFPTFQERLSTGHWWVQSMFC